MKDKPVEPEVEEINYTFVCDNGDDFDIFANDAVFYFYVWNEDGTNDWVPMKRIEGTKSFVASISSAWQNCNIVRMNPNPGEGVELPSWNAKWNQSDNLKLGGENSEIHFALKQS